MPYMKSKNGFALSIVMWIVAALLLGIAFVLSLSKSSLSLTEGLQDKLIAREKAQNYLEVIKYYILTANYNSFELINNSPISKYKLPKEIVLDGRDYNLTKNVTLSMKDASSMLNVFYPNWNIIPALASKKDSRLYYTMKDSIEDWIDTDSKVSLNGAEDAYYQKQKNVLYKPRNYPALQSIEELRLIKGVDDLSQKQFDILKTYLYYSSNSASIDLALVDPYLFSKLLHIDKQTAQKIINYKYNNYAKFINILDKNSYYNDYYMGVALSFHILIKIKVKVGKAVVLLETFMDFKKNNPRSIMTDKYIIY